MTQTFNRVKDSLVALLQDEDHKVVALTGKWGTGKTYLWRSIANELHAKVGGGEPIYVSLFGAKTVDALKIRILQNAYLKNAPAVKKAIDDGSGIIKDVFNAVRSATGFSTEGAATGLALIWFQKIVKDKLIIIDDVERKNKSLEIDEFLGMIDEYSETHNTRFLLLLNTNKLLDNEPMWATFHEKVIDAEVVLDPPRIRIF